MFYMYMYIQKFINSVKQKNILKKNYKTGSTSLT